MAMAENMLKKMMATMMAMVLLSAVAISEAAAALPQARTAGTQDNSTSASTNVRHGRRLSSHHHHHHSSYVPVNGQGQPCAASPLLDRKVDPASYEFGCREIEEMLAGPMTALNQGVVRNVSRVEYHGKTLVVKTLLQQDQPSHYLKHLEMHQLEVLILDTLAGHPNIVQMLGFCDEAIVTDYYETVNEVLFREGRELPIAEVASLALDSARGLEALHVYAGCIHVDLKPAQFLVDRAGHILLNDFNRCHVMSIDPYGGKFCSVESAARHHYSPWPAPENYAGELLTEKSDIYGLGMLFFSIIAGRLPFHGDPDLLESAFSHESRPAMDPSWHAGFVEVIQEMWAQDPNNRPSAQVVVARLEGILRDLGVQPNPPVLKFP